MTYIVKYIVKDPIEVMAALVLIQKARIKAIRSGSISDDGGTDMRKSVNHIMKMVNMFTAAKEVPACDTGHHSTEWEREVCNEAGAL